MSRSFHVTLGFGMGIAAMFVWIWLTTPAKPAGGVRTPGAIASDYRPMTVTVILMAEPSVTGAAPAALPDDAPRGCDPHCIERSRCAAVREDECAAMAKAICERNVGPGATALTYCHAAR